jgi:hypothetical protein
MGSRSVPPESSWTPDWVLEIFRVKAVNDGRIKVVFVGQFEHIERLVLDARLLRTVIGVRTTTFEPWSDSFTDRVLKGSGLC